MGQQQHSVCSVATPHRRWKTPTEAPKALVDNHAFFNACLRAQVAKRDAEEARKAGRCEQLCHADSAHNADVVFVPRGRKPYCISTAVDMTLCTLPVWIT